MNAVVHEEPVESRVKRWGLELGFDAVAIAGTELAEEESRLLEWLGRGWHGEMDYMARHGARRARPAELIPGTVSIITVRLDYQPSDARDAQAVLDDPDRAFVSRYALGRDYHKVMRSKLQQLAERTASGAHRHRTAAPGGNGTVTGPSTLGTATISDTPASSCTCTCVVAPWKTTSCTTPSNAFSPARACVVGSTSVIRSGRMTTAPAPRGTGTSACAAS